MTGLYWKKQTDGGGKNQNCFQLSLQINSENNKNIFLQFWFGVIFNSFLKTGVI